MSIEHGFVRRFAGAARHDIYTAEENAKAFRQGGIFAGGSRPLGRQRESAVFRIFRCR